MKTSFQRGYRRYTSICRSMYLAVEVAIVSHARLLMICLGLMLITLGMCEFTLAQDAPGLGVQEGGERIAIVTSRLFQLIEGNAGSLIMVIAGLGAIISAAFGAYRAAVGLIVVAVGAFILRALVDIFFDFDYQP